MAVGIYKITSPTNKIYIGQSWGLRKRECEYKRLSNSIKAQRKIYNSLKKYGWESHTYEVVMNVSENVTQEMLDQIEQAYMDYYRKLGFELMNLREAGRGGKMSEESKKKVSEARKGKPCNRVYTKEHREAIAEWSRGRVKSEEERQKISNTLKGHAVSTETKRKLSVANTGNKHTDETKAKISAASIISNAKRSKPILQYDLEGNLQREWPSVTQAARTLGISHSAISKCLSGKNKTALKSIWKYKSENN